MSISLLIKTYNQVDLLEKVLRGVDRQTSMPDEIILADDGSTDGTKELFLSYSKRWHSRSVFVSQTNRGFRASRILNRAIICAKGDYLVFLDGDSVPESHFIEDHRAFAKKGFFIQGHRALVQKKALSYFGNGNLTSERWRAMLSFQLKGVKNAWRWPVPSIRVRSDLRGIRACNQAVWRNDMLKINGYNEAFEGWGREDSELAIRLLNSGIKRQDLRGRACCFHLWHEPSSRVRLNENDRLLEDAIRSGKKYCQLGIAEIDSDPEEYIFLESR